MTARDVRKPRGLDRKRQRTALLVLAGLCLINLPIYFFLVRPVILADEIVTAKANEVRQQLRNRTSVTNRLKDIETQMIRSRHRFEAFKQENIFPSDQGNSELLRELDEICQNAGLVRTRGAFTYDKEPRFGMQRVTISMPIEGSYSNIRNLLNVLETRPKFIIIDSLALQDNREGSGTIQMDLRLSTLIGSSQ